MKQADYAILAAILAIAIGICLAMFLRPSVAEGTRHMEFAEPPHEAAYDPTAEAPQPIQESTDSEGGAEAAYEPGTVAYTPVMETAPYTASEPFGVSGDPDGLNSFVGVVEWNGRTETAYSSNVLYHYRTSEWTPDEFGFYRTDDGLYVVGSDDYEMGSVIETSRGPALVADCGGDPGITDFYVNW